jgi:hypothetical protein
MPNDKFPESYKDPLYTQLDSSFEQKYGLPVGLVSAIREHGEKTDASRVSSAGARTPYQFIPETRNAIRKQSGIDVYLNPENAAEGAALLARDSLKRNGGDEEKAIREYHGGTDPKNWGPVNNAYYARVSAGRQPIKESALNTGFQKFMRENPATLQSAQPTRAPQPQTKDALSEGFGQWLQATKPASELIDQIPGIIPEGPRQPEPGLIDKTIGTGEAALSVLTGATTGALGLAAGATKGIAQSILNGTFGTQDALRAVENAAASGAEAMTYAPRTQAGQETAQAIGQGIGEILPLMPMTAGIAPALSSAGNAAALARSALVNQAGKAAQAVKSGTQAATDAIGAKFKGGPPAETVAQPIDLANTSKFNATPAAVEPIKQAVDVAATAKKAADGGLFGGEKANNALVSEVAPNPRLLKDYERLGITQHIDPGHVTTSEAFRQVDAALKNIPTGQLAQAEKVTLNAIAERANNVIERLGGSRDVSTVSEAVKSDMVKSVDSLKAAAKKIYDDVDAQIPKNTQVQSTATKEFLSKRANELGGVEFLSPGEKNTLRALGGDTSPTYGLLNETRTNLNAVKYNAGDNPWATSSDAIRDGLLNAMRRDQVEAIRSTNPDLVPKWEVAQQLTQQRKGIQNDLTALFKRNWDSSIAGELNSSLGAAAKGDSTRLAKFIARVPESMREEVVLTGISGIIKKAATRGEMDFTGYYKWFNNLKRNRQSYNAVMSSLPLSTRKQLQALANVSEGISNSLAARTKTGLQSSIEKSLEGPDNLLFRMQALAQRSLVAGTVGTAVGSVAGPGFGAAVASALTKGKKPSSIVAVDNLIASREFVQAIQAEVGKAPEAVKQKAVLRLVKSDKFDRFVKAVGNPPELTNRQKWVLQSLRPIPSNNQNSSETKP